MSVEVRFNDEEGLGTFLTLCPSDLVAEDSKSVVKIQVQAEYSDTIFVRLSADDVEKLIEELKQYTKKPELKYTHSYIYPSIDVPGYKPQVWCGGTTTNNTYLDKNGD